MCFTGFSTISDLLREEKKFLNTGSAKRALVKKQSTL
jgi:hypothetical protein